jgi:hypothetical protein
MGGLADLRSAAERSALERAVRATAFGLDVQTRAPVRLLRGARAAPTGRALELIVDEHETRAKHWPDGAELVCDQREVDGSVSFRIEHDARAGYLIEGPAYGASILELDGRRVRCMPEGRADHSWQRLLIAQVLPFAAILQGLEALHASAVVTKLGAIALSGPSRVGKTTLALELCRRGARFLADDVLALECTGGQLLGHPGSPVAGLAHAEARRLESARTQLSAELLAVNAREQLVAMRAARGPAPLAALFFLERRSAAPAAPRFEVVTEPRTLLAATFNTVLIEPARLRALLELCAVISTRRVERVVIGPRTGVEQLAAAIEQRIGVPA